MKLRIRDEDRRAVDMLLDHKGQGSTVFAAGGRIRESIARVEKVLGLLDNMAAGDPPRDLATRTLEYIERTSRNMTPSPDDSVFNHPPIS